MRQAARAAVGRQRGRPLVAPVAGSLRPHDDHGGTVTGVPIDAAEGRFTLGRGERTHICARAVTPDGTRR